MMLTSPAGDRPIPTMPLKQGGYTLLELLVVLTVLAMVSAIATGYVTIDRGSQRVKLEAYRLETDLRSARSSAIFTGHAVAFTVDVARGSWRYGADVSHTVSQKIHLTLYTGRQLQIGGTAGAIEFFPSGESSGGHVTLLSEGYSAQIDVDWLTGRIHPHFPDDPQ